MVREKVEGRPRARRLLRALVLLIVLPVFLVVVFAAVAPFIITGERVRATLVSALTDTLGVAVRIDRLDYRPLSGVDLDGIVLGPPEGFSEDLLRIERIAIRWSFDDLGSGRVAITELRVKRPVIVLETRGGRRNLDAILARSEAESVPSEPDEEPGPLLPLDIVLDEVEIGPIELRVVGEGPNVHLSEVTISVDGTAGRESIDLSLSVAAEPVEGKDNVHIVLPAVEGQPVVVRAPLSLDLSLSVEGASSKGLALTTVSLAAKLEAELAAAWGAKVLPRAPLALSVDAALGPAEDRAELGPIAIDLFGTNVLRAGGEVDGIFDALADLAGVPIARSLATGIGLVDRDRGGNMVARLAALELDLDRLMPWIEPFVEGVRAKGRVSVEGLEVGGTAKELLLGLPSSLRGSIVLEDVGVDMGPLSVARTSGRFTASREGVRYGLAGVADVGPISREGVTIPRARVRLGAGADRLQVPRTGKTTVDVELTVPTAKLETLASRGASIRIGVSGDDPFDDDRTMEPIAVEVSVEVGAMRIASSTSSIDIDDPRVVIHATLDRLSSASRSPIDATIDASVSSVSLAAGRRVEGMGVSLVLAAGDPRIGMFDVDADLGVSARSIEVGPARIEKGKVTVSVRARGIGPHEAPGFPGGAPPMLPASVTAVVALDAPRITVRDHSAFELETAVRFDTAYAVNPLRGEIEFERAEIRIPDVARLAWKGRVESLYQPLPRVDLDVRLDPVDLRKLLAEVPRALLGPAGDLDAEGTLALKGRAKGTIPTAFTKTALVKQPITGRLEVELSGIGLESKGLEIDVSGLGGRITAEVGEGRVATETALDVAHIGHGSGRPSLRTEVQRLSIRNRVGLAEDVWTASSNIRAEKVVSALGGDAVEGASIALDASYPQRGDFAIDRFEIKAPGNGVELSLSGSLARKTFGVFRPSFDLAARIDLDRLRQLLPELRGGSGRAIAELSITSKGERTLDVGGKLALDRFSYEVPGAFALVGANGRVPLEQRFLLPAPEPDEAVALEVGPLGDDFVARLLELAGHLEAARALVDSSDILVEAPRAADYQALRPYMAATGAFMTIEGVAVGSHALEDVILEGLWRSGVLRIDRFACRMWEGDLLGDLALQLTADRNLEVRMRGTMTDVNVDIPYAVAKGIEPVKDPSAKEDFRISGQVDVEFSLRQKAIDARVDLVKLSLPLVRRAFGALLLEDSPAVQALDIAQYAGVRPKGGRIWISNNLANFVLDWEQLWIHVSLDQPTIAGKIVDVLLFLPRPLLVPTLGGYVVNTVNGAVRDFSISAIVEQIPALTILEEKLELFEGRLLAKEEADSRGKQAAKSP